MPVSDLSIPSVRSLYELNVFSPIRTIQLFLPLLMASKNSPILITNTSCAALQPVGGLPWTAAYNSSKAALSSITETLRYELAPFDIRVVEVRTGNVKSNFFVNLSAKSTASETVPKLPEDSLYATAREDLEDFMSGSLMDTDGQDQAVYARGVVSDLNGGWFRGVPDVVYRGRHASEVKWLYGLQGLVPRWLVEYLVRDIGKVNGVEKKVRVARATGKAS